MDTPHYTFQDQSNYQNIHHSLVFPESTQIEHPYTGKCQDQQISRKEADWLAVANLNYNSHNQQSSLDDFIGEGLLQKGLQNEFDQVQEHDLFQKSQEMKQQQEEITIQKDNINKKIILIDSNENDFNLIQSQQQDGQIKKIEQKKQSVKKKYAETKNAQGDLMNHLKKLMIRRLKELQRIIESKEFHKIMNKKSYNLRDFQSLFKIHQIEDILRIIFQEGSLKRQVMVAKYQEEQRKQDLKEKDYQNQNIEENSNAHFLQLVLEGYNAVKN